MGCGPSKEAGGAASPARAEPDIFQVETPAAPPKAPEPEPPAPPPRPQASPPIVAASCLSELQMGRSEICAGLRRIEGPVD